MKVKDVMTREVITEDEDVLVTLSRETWKSKSHRITKNSSGSGMGG